MRQMSPDPEQPDRFFIVGGRRWRRSDPGIPEPLRRELVDALMDSRRAVKRALAIDDGLAVPAPCGARR